MKKLWQKNNKSKLNPLIESYTVGDDVLWDTQLLSYDIKASLAHANMLNTIGILSSSELSDITKAFDDLDLSNIILTTSDEDSSTYLENYLVSKIGETGKKIHAGRSRNDQVLVTLRLFEKDQLQILINLCTELIGSLKAYSQKYQKIPMPGYTHGQQAMLSSVGHIFQSYYESLSDDKAFLELVLHYIDQNPLGSAASFGVNLPLDRNFTTKLLSFSKTQHNSIYCQNSKGKFESLILESLTQVMMTLNKISSDMIFYLSQECGFFSLSDVVTTGSSIMPHKKNPDVFEIMRGKGSIVTAHQFFIKDLCKNLMSGYQRDTQLIKKPLFESFDIVKESLEVWQVILLNLKPQKDVIQSKITPDILTANIANDLVVNEGMSFREAYNKAPSLVPNNPNYEDLIDTMVSEGAAGNYCNRTQD